MIKSKSKTKTLKINKQQEKLVENKHTCVIPVTLTVLVPIDIIILSPYVL